MNSSDTQRGDITPAPYVPGVIPPERLQFWLDTCREVGHMHCGAKPVIEFYRQYGCRFFEPGLDQVHHVVEALDSAVPMWEKTHPELFYQTLELNFPELVRRVA